MHADSALYNLRVYLLENQISASEVQQYRKYDSNIFYWRRIESYDISIGSTETKYIKLNTKTKNIFCCVNENLTTFFTHFDRGVKKTEGEKSFLF